MKSYSNARLAALPAFTLIELLVVMSILSLLASIIFASGSYARARAADAAQAQTMHTVQAAIAAHIAERGYPPPNYNFAGQICEYGDDNCLPAYSDETQQLSVTYVDNNGEEHTELMNRYQASMNHLVVGGYLTHIPESANRSSALGYFDFGYETEIGAVLYGALATHTASEEGEDGTCRFNTAQSQALKSPMERSSLLAHIGSLFSKVADASSFFISTSSGPLWLGTTTEDYELIPVLSGRWSGRFNQVVTPISGSQMILDNSDIQYMNNQSSSQQSQNLSLDPDDDEQDQDDISRPTCSPDLNRSYCLCSSY